MKKGVYALLLALALLLCCAGSALAADYSYSATAGDTVSFRATPDFSSAVSNLTHKYDYVSGSSMMSGLVTKIVTSDMNSENKMAVLAGTIPASASLGTYHYQATIAYQYNGRDYSFSYTVDVTVTAPPDQYKTVTTSATVGQAISCGWLDYDTPSGWNSASGVITDSSFPNTLSEYGLGGAYSANGFAPSGTPTKAGTAQYTVALSYPNYTFYVTYKIEIAAAPKPATAALPTISSQPTGASLTIGTPLTIGVSASASDGGSLSYQWYQTTVNDMSTIKAISGATYQTYTVPQSEGTVYYCVGVWNTKDGVVSQPVYSKLAAVTYSKATTPVTPSTYIFPFTDVYVNDWYYNDVMNANKLRLIDGKTPNLYKPDDNMTYAEAIKLAACMHQLFHDGAVSLKNGSPNWYQSYVDYAKQNGIPWSFADYNTKITRAEYVYVFYYALPSSEYTQINTINSLPDVKAGDKFSAEIFAFYKAGILTGNNAAGAFSPNSNIKRSEVAAILSRMMDDSARKTFTLVP